MAEELITQNDLLKILSIDTLFLQKWLRDGLPIHSEDEGGNLYNFKEVMLWIVENDLDFFRETMNWNFRLKKARALSLELKLEVDRGNFLSKKEVDQDNANKILLVKEKWQQMPRSLGQYLVGEEIEEIEKQLTLYVEEALSVFRNE